MYKYLIMTDLKFSFIEFEKEGIRRKSLSAPDAQDGILLKLFLYYFMRRIEAKRKGKRQCQPYNFMRGTEMYGAYKLI